MTSVNIPIQKPSNGFPSSPGGRGSFIFSFFVKGVSVYVKPIAPIKNAKFFSVDFDKVRSAVIAILYLLKSPLAIPRFVISVVIYPFYGMLWRWPRPHVVQKISKIASPSFAHNYSARAITVISWVIWVVAPLLYSLPNSKLRCFAGSMRSVKIGVIFSDPTPATERSFTYIRASRYGSISTVTLAAPHSVFSVWFSVITFEYSKAANFLALQINKARHLVISILFDTNMEYHGLKGL